MNMTIISMIWHFLFIHLKGGNTHQPWQSMNEL